MILHSVWGGDHQNGVVGKGQSALGLCGEIHVAGGIQKNDVTALGGEAGLLGKNRDASLPLHGIVVQIGIAVIHSPTGAELARRVQKSLGQGGLSRIHVGEDADGQLLFHGEAPFFEMGISQNHYTMNFLFFQRIGDKKTKKSRLSRVAAEKGEKKGRILLNF